MISLTTGRALCLDVDSAIHLIQHRPRDRMRAKFVKLKSWDWNICSSVAHPPPLCISSRVPVNPTCVSSQTLCFILYILFKPLPVNSYFSCIPKHQLDSFCILLFHCQYTPFSILKRKHLYILPNTIWFFLLYTLSFSNYCQYTIIFLSKRKHFYILPNTNLMLFALYFISFPKPGRVYLLKKKARAYIYIPYPNPTRPPSHG